jgi:hypothetical protein
MLGRVAGIQGEVARLTHSSVLFVRYGRRIPHVRGTLLPQIRVCRLDGEQPTRLRATPAIFK